MFTGIVEQLGTIKSIRHQRNLMTLGIDAGRLSWQIKPGDSVAINGVCLTASRKKGRVVDFDLMKETIEKTSLQSLKTSDPVNLELALKASSRFGGHFVTGHVDEVSRIKKIKKAKNWLSFTLSISKSNHKYLVPKGSIAVDGVSLTVGKVGTATFDVYLIPYTLKITTLGYKKANDLVNIEIDILAKYIK